MTSKKPTSFQLQWPQPFTCNPCCLACLCIRPPLTHPPLLPLPPDTLPYLTAKLLAEFPVSCLFPLLFGGVVYPLTGLNRKPLR